MIDRRILCNDLAELATICAELVQHGVTFRAHAWELTIYLTGGF